MYLQQLAQFPAQSRCFMHTMEWMNAWMNKCPSLYQIFPLSLQTCPSLYFLNKWNKTKTFPCLFSLQSLFFLLSQARCIILFNIIAINVHIWFWVPLSHLTIPCTCWKCSRCTVAQGSASHVFSILVLLPNFCHIHIPTLCSLIQCLSLKQLTFLIQIKLF